jgi:nicotinate-nucleotide adenylyltransferase
MRTGVFGGTFDPVHKGHLNIANAALDQAALDRILFVVAAKPPHKRNNQLTETALRVQMVEAAIADHPAFQVSLVEIERQGYSFTADTLKILKEEDPEGELFFIIGSDSARDLPNWREPQRILDQAALLVAPRPDCPETLPAMLQSRASLLKLEPWDISSSVIRKRIQQGKEIQDMLPQAVWDIIRRERLYQSCR